MQDFIALGILFHGEMGFVAEIFAIIEYDLFRFHAYSTSETIFIITHTPETTLEHIFE